MPYTASLKGQSRTILVGLAKTKEQNQSLLIALGISIPTEEKIESKFRDDEFKSIAHLFANANLDISTYLKPSKMLAIKKPIAFIGSTIQRFVLAGRKCEEVFELEDKERLTLSWEENALAFKKYKASFLAKADEYQQQAITLAKNWLTQYQSCLGNYNVVDYEALRQDVLFPKLYAFMENLFETEASFQKAVLQDAKKFVERDSQRFVEETSQTMTPDQKAVVRYFSVLHFLEQAAVFTLLWVRYQVDAFAYPGDEILTHAELKKARLHEALVSLLAIPELAFSAPQKPMSSLVIITKKERAPRNKKVDQSAIASSSAIFSDPVPVFVVDTKPMTGSRATSVEKERPITPSKNYLRGSCNEGASSAPSSSYFTACEDSLSEEAEESHSRGRSVSDPAQLQAALDILAGSYSTRYLPAQSSGSWAGASFFRGTSIAPLGTAMIEEIVKTAGGNLQAAVLLGAQYSEQILPHIGSQPDSSDAMGSDLDALPFPPPA